MSPPCPPTTIRLPAPPLCLAAHPTHPLLAAGLSGGQIAVISPRSQSPICATHTLASSVPALTFLQTRGSAADPTSFRLLAAASDASTVSLFESVRRDALRAYALPPHEGVPRCATAFLALGPDTAVVGDDAGGLHLLDARVARLQAAVLQQGDYISALAAYPRAQGSGSAAAAATGDPFVLAASGDGTLCAYDLRVAAGKRALPLVHVSEAFNDDLLSLAVLDAHGNGNGNGAAAAAAAAPRAVAGCLSGALNVYDLAALLHGAPDERRADASVARFHGHPECVNAVLATPAPDVVATASTDGLVRVVDVDNHALLGVLDYDRAPLSRREDACADADADADADGGAKKKGGNAKKRKKTLEDWPIEAMVRLNGTHKLTYALVSHEECVRLCDASVLCDDGSDGEDADTRASEDAEGNEPSTPQSARRGLLQTAEPLETKSQKKKKKKKQKRRGSDAATQSGSEKRGSAFFDQL